MNPPNDTEAPSGAHYVYENGRLLGGRNDFISTFDIPAEDVAFVIALLTKAKK